MAPELTPGMIALIVASHFVMVLAMVTLVVQQMALRRDLGAYIGFRVRSTMMEAKQREEYHEEIMEVFTEEVSDEVQRT